MFFDYLFIYLVNPLFLLLDYISEYTESKKNKVEEKIEKYEYDLNEDKIKITYFSNDENKFIFKLDRKLDIYLKGFLDEMKEINSDAVLYGASINGKDILSRVLSYMGPSGNHNKVQKLLVKDVLTEEEIANFESLVVVDELCEVNELTELNDYIL